MNSFKKMWRRKVKKSNSRKALLGNNNETMKDAYDSDLNRSSSSLALHSFEIQEEQQHQRKGKITAQQLAEHLEVQPDAISSNTGQTNKRLIKKSVCQHLPEPPADLDPNLNQHLEDVRNVVLSELLRLSPSLEPEGLMGHVIECYHRQIFEHLHHLLQNVRSSGSLFVLLNWGLKTYLSEHMLFNSAIQKLDPIKKIDVLLLTDWERKVTTKLLESVQKEVRQSLDQILQNDREKKKCDADEDYVHLYVDTIGCIDAVHGAARKISCTLSEKVQEVCFSELLTFVKRYNTEQMEVVREPAKLDKPGVIHFFKTLKMCKELKTYVQLNGRRNSLCGEIGTMLGNMETLTLKRLINAVADFAKRHLTTYFTRDNKRLSLLDAVKTLFSDLPIRQDDLKMVMDEVYKVIVSVYVDHLTNTSLSKLRKCWRCEVGPTVAQDAELLHCTMCDLAPGVQPWNLMLVRIAEVLEGNCIDGLKLTVAAMQMGSLTKSDDPDFLLKLLQWKGLSKSMAVDVLDAALPDYQPRATSTCFSCLACS